MCFVVTSNTESLADLGGVPGTRARAQGSRFFRFDIQNFRNVTALGVGALPPLREILDPPLRIIKRVVIETTGV